MVKTILMEKTQCLQQKVEYQKYIISSTRASNALVGTKIQNDGLNRDLNPGPPAPKAGIIPLDH